MVIDGGGTTHVSPPFLLHCEVGKMVKNVLQYLQSAKWRFEVKGPIVYRLGHILLKDRSAVRLRVGSQNYLRVLRYNRLNAKGN